MKAKYFILFFLFGCAKVDQQGIQTEQYKDLVGTWVTDYENDELRTIKISSKGKVEITKSTERKATFYITHFYFEKSAVKYDGDSLYSYTLSRKKNNKTQEYVLFYKMPFEDSAFINPTNFFIKDFENDTLNFVPYRVYYKK